MDTAQDQLLSAVTPTQFVNPEDKSKKNRFVIYIGIFILIVGFVASLYLVQNKSFNLSLAWNCNTYTFNVSQRGTVYVFNNSTRNEPGQQAQVYINNVLVSTLGVPQLASGENSIIGTVIVPESGIFTWRVSGLTDCDDQGNYQGVLTTPTVPPGTTTVTATPITSVTTTVTPTTEARQSEKSTDPTSTPTVTPTTSVTATISPTGTLTTTATPTTQVTATPTGSQSQNNSINTITPTSGLSGSAQGTGDMLASAGVSLPTLLGLTIGILFIAGALLLAI